MFSEQTKSNILFWVTSFAIIAIGVVAGLGVFNFFNPTTSEIMQISDVNGLETAFASLASDINGLRNDVGILAINQRTILSTVLNLQEQRLCGVNQLIPDSNRINEVPRGIIYSCFAQVNN